MNIVLKPVEKYLPEEMDFIVALDHAHSGVDYSEVALVSSWQKLSAGWVKLKYKCFDSFIIERGGSRMCAKGL